MLKNERKIATVTIDYGQRNRKVFYALKQVARTGALTGIALVVTPVMAKPELTLLERGVIAVTSAAVCVGTFKEILRGAKNRQIERQSEVERIKIAQGYND